MSILTEQGRILLAELVKARPLHVAWGEGDGAWVPPVPEEDEQAAGLVQELGRRVATSADFVVPDPDGPIEIPGHGFFSISTKPTKRLLVVAQFAFADAPTATIRQTAVFVGTQVIDGLPPGQRYFAPAQIQSQGRMLQLQNLPQPIPRDSEYRTRTENLIVF